MSEQHTESLLHYVERIEDAAADRQAASDIMAGHYAAAKAAGYLPALVRQVVKERRIESSVRAGQYATLDSYRRELGLFADTPLGAAAVAAWDRVGNNIVRPRPFA
jgi:uncharacterized protein (UPF0335 family)